MRAREGREGRWRAGGHAAHAGGGVVLYRSLPQSTDRRASGIIHQADYPAAPTPSLARHCAPLFLVSGPPSAVPRLYHCMSEMCLVSAKRAAPQSPLISYAEPTPWFTSSASQAGRGRG